MVHREFKQWVLVAAMAATSSCGGRRPATSSPVRAEVETRLYQHVHVLAADSMQGRRAGTLGYDRAASYVVSQLQRMGLRPSGDHATFLQSVPRVERTIAPASFVEASGTRLVIGEDVRPLIFGSGQPRSIDGIGVVFGGTHRDTASYVSGEEVPGKLVVLRGPRAASDVYRGVIFPPDHRFGRAAAVAVVSLDLLPTAQRETGTSVALADSNDAPAARVPSTLLISRRAATVLLGADPDSVTLGARGSLVRGQLLQIERRTPTANVIATIPGRDPKYRGQYVVLGAHLDHLGTRPALGSQASDSVFHGADDNASGASALLRIAADLMDRRSQLRRTVVLVWFTAEEGGLMGSRWFSDHAPVPLDSVVAYLNLDMIGRRNPASDGSPTLRILGLPRSLATLDQVRQLTPGHPSALALDTIDANDSFCRSDQVSLMKKGVPVVAFTTGTHRDYHQVTDEADRIDYDVLAEVARLVGAVAVDLATRADISPSMARSAPPSRSC